MIDYSSVNYDYLSYIGMSAEPKQLRVLKKLTAHLELTPGYAPLRVFRGRGVVTANEAEDCLSILEAPQAEFGAPVGSTRRRKEQWPLLLQGWPKDDPVNPSDPAYLLKAAVEKQLSGIVDLEDPSGAQRTDPLYMLGGDVVSFSIGTGIVRPANDETGKSRLAYFFIPLLLEIATDKAQPQL